MLSEQSFSELNLMIDEIQKMLFGLQKSIKLVTRNL